MRYRPASTSPTMGMAGSVPRWRVRRPIGRFPPTGRMFATLLGRLPPPPASADPDEAVREAIAAQELAGLEPLTEGRLRWAGDLGPLGDLRSWDTPLTVDEWRFAAACTTRAVKQSL